MAIPHPELQRLALHALDSKRCNVEGAAAFELLARRGSAPSLVRTLTSWQAMCDYLDLLAEQPSADPILNGACLHQAVTVAVAPGEAHRDYYAHHAHRDDGGYLRALVEDVQAGLAELPAFARIRAPLTRCAERIVAYQSFNHGDVHGSYALFERWASTQLDYDSGMSWWEVGGGAGSTLTAFALIACAVDERLDEAAVHAVERAYFPWIGALHSLLDSLVDQSEDLLAGERGLIGCYATPEIAGERLCEIAREAFAQAARLPDGRRHRLLAVSMTGFYLCEARGLRSAYACAAVPRLVSAIGRLGRVAMRMMGARHAMRRPTSTGLASMLDQRIEAVEDFDGGRAGGLGASVVEALDVRASRVFDDGVSEALDDGVSHALQTCALADNPCGG